MFSIVEMFANAMAVHMSPNISVGFEVLTAFTEEHTPLECDTM
jgi:hypothetical protein